VIVKVTGDHSEPIRIDVSSLSSVQDAVEVVATTTAAGGAVPDWTQHCQTLKLVRTAQQKLIETELYPKSIYTFVMTGILR
jgi:hypothetical protein